LSLQINCNNDMALLLSSGFQAASSNRTQMPLEKPAGLVLKTGASGQLVAKVAPVKNTSLYEVVSKVCRAIGCPASLMAILSTLPLMG
jgi:hypothetical protein